MPAKVLDALGKVLARLQMPSGMAVARMLGSLERERDHGSQHQRCRQRVLLIKRFGRARQQLVSITVKFAVARQNEFGRPCMRRPVNKECQCLMHIQALGDMRQGFDFGLFIVEVRQALEMGPQVFSIEAALEDRPALLLRFDRSSQSIECIDPDPLPVRPMAALSKCGFSHGKCSHGLGCAIGGQEPFCDLSRDRRVCTFFG